MAGCFICPAGRAAAGNQGSKQASRQACKQAGRQQASRQAGRQAVDPARQVDPCREGFRTYGKPGFFAP